MNTWHGQHLVEVTQLSFEKFQFLYGKYKWTSSDKKMSH